MASSSTLLSASSSPPPSPAAAATTAVKWGQSAYHNLLRPYFEQALTLRPYVSVTIDLADSEVHVCACVCVATWPTSGLLKQKCVTSAVNDVSVTHTVLARFHTRNVQYRTVFLRRRSSIFPESLKKRRVRSYYSASQRVVKMESHVLCQIMMLNT